MAGYAGYGYGTTPSQSYANVQQAQGTYAAQNTAATGYAAQQTQYATPARQMVQPGYGVASAYPTSNYGYGRPDTQVQNSQAGYGQSGYATRGSTYDSSKQGYYSSPTQGTNTGYSYGTQPVKQETYQSAANNTGQYPSHSGYETSGQVMNTAPKKAGNQHSQNAYEGVVYNAATSFLQQQSHTSKPQWQRHSKPQFRLHGKGRGGGSSGGGNQGPPRTEQLHYCEVCKISCAGAGTYKEHLEGQKHKKKEALVAAQSKMAVPRGSYRCELCCITCTGADAYNAHVKGARHVKTVKLHQKLGKPIPESKGPPASKTAASTSAQTVTKIATPKINFVGGTKLFTTKDGSQEQSETAETVTTSKQEEETDVVEEDAQIVGEEYVESAPDDSGRAGGFKCTLCDCRFNDDVAKTAHLKGRRHRLNYKKKVQPSLKVDMKGSRRNARTVQEERSKRAGGKDGEHLWRQRQNEQMHREHQLRMREEELRRWEEEEYGRKVGEDRYWTRPDRHQAVEMEKYENECFDQNKSVVPLMSMHGGQQQTGPSLDDRIVMAKHSSVYPTDEELKQVQNTVSAVEKSLKLVSDLLATQNAPVVEKLKPAEPKVDEQNDTTEKESTDEHKDTPMTEESTQRALKGVMRVGILAKGLLLRNQMDVSVVVLCTEIPTVTLLNQVASFLPQTLQEVSDEKFVLEIKGHQMIIQSENEPKCTVTICLTSPVVRQQEEKTAEADLPAIAEDPVTVADTLEKDKCLKALASLRHAKWFQAKANGLQSCVIIIRIVRDLRNNVPAFKPLSDWMIELLVEKSLCSSRFLIGPGAGFRRFLELISSGILLPGGSGLIDPCEKEQTDATKSLTPQEREDITSEAQTALRLMAFRQLGQVLSIDVQEILKSSRGAKRRLDSTSDTTDTDAKQSKQDESEVTEIKTEEASSWDTPETS